MKILKEHRYEFFLLALKKEIIEKSWTYITKKSN